ncbi:PREDICTED: ameloblastin [Nanorana parkeri]|uniref:ameloblastin n=1 Tax=Nanorana parkeri TaxID=125878 RepID=UPI0008545E1D|nr:PREDICTED: ameloblastin [Nanorana parkeri]
MEELALVLCMLGSVLSYPVNPQVGGTHGMASMSLETMQQLQTANKLTALPQLSRFGYDDSTLWLHGLLPPHMYPWLHQRSQMPDNQQFEYALPIHPPPLPGVPSVGQPAKFGQDGQTVPQQSPATSAKADQLVHQPVLPLGFPNIQQGDPTLIPPKGGPADGQIQTVALFMYQTIMNKLLQQGAADHVPDPAGVPPIHQQHPYPNLFFMNYGTGPGLPPARFGMMSSEEMQGGAGAGAGAAHPLSYLYPGLLGVGPSLGGKPLNPAMAGDFTIEDDSPGAGVKPAGQGVAQIPAEIPQVAGLNPSMSGLEGIPPGQIDTLQFPNIHLPNMGLNPLGQSKGPLPVTPANVPKLTHDTAAGFAPYGIDEPLIFGIQRENPTNMDIGHGNNGIDSPIMNNDIHLQNHYFQEP